MFKFTPPVRVVSDLGIKMPLDESIVRNAERMEDLLDAITLAVERGEVDPENWDDSLFTGPEAHTLFYERLEEFDGRIHDRWFDAFCHFCVNLDDNTNIGKPQFLLDALFRS